MMRFTEWEISIRLSFGSMIRGLEDGGMLTLNIMLMKVDTQLTAIIHYTTMTQMVIIKQD